jgi:LemA protein
MTLCPAPAIPFRKGRGYQSISFDFIGRLSRKIGAIFISNDYYAIFIHMKNKTLWIVLAVIVLAVIYGWTAYNSFVSANTNVDKQWAQVETQYQRRFDLIPNLVNSVKGMMSQEKSVFDAISEARTKYSGAATIDEKAGAAQQVETALGRLLVVMENYPQLKSAENVQTLMVQLEGTENRIGTERTRFNEAVQALNLKVKTFPSNMIAKIFGFTERVYFEATEGADSAPQVNL